MFKLDTNYLDWQLKFAQSQNQDKYEDPVKKEYGPECVQKAIDETNGKDIGNY
jgi:hypothetical protein